MRQSGRLRRRLAALPERFARVQDGLDRLVVDEAGDPPPAAARVLSHFADAPSLSLLKRLLKEEGGANRNGARPQASLSRTDGSRLIPLKVVAVVLLMMEGVPAE